MFKNIKVFLFLVITALSLVACGSDTDTTKDTKDTKDTKEAVKIEITGTPLAYLEIKKDETIRAAIERNRLDVTVVVNEDQSKATSDDFLVTVMIAAMDYQKANDLPVVTVNMIAQKTSHSTGEAQLARATYIPDGKGIDGKQKNGQWETLEVVKRAFTQAELEYLRNWADMRTQFMDVNENVNDEALVAAISEKMGIEKNSLSPLSNITWSFERDGKRVQSAKPIPTAKKEALTVLTEQQVREQVQALLAEFDTFKDTAIFKQCIYGCGAKNPGSAWEDKRKALHAQMTPQLDAPITLKLLPAKLWQLGMDYGKGKLDEARKIRANIDSSIGKL